MRRSAFAAGSIACIALFGLRSATPSVEITETALRMHLTAFAHDSMEGRETGARGAGRASAYIVAALSRAAVGPGTPAGYLQSVPLVRSQFDTSTAQMWMQLSQEDSVRRPAAEMWAPSNFIPINGAFGFSSPREAQVPEDTTGASLKTRRALGIVSQELYVFGGRLGATVVDPKIVEERPVFFLPPLLRDGAAEYELWRVRDELIKYRKASAIVIASLDLMPGSFVSRMLEPQWTLEDHELRAQPMPPIVAVTHRWGARVMRVGKINIDYRSPPSPPSVPPANVVAIVEGSDAKLKDEYVMVSAPLDHIGVRKPRSGTDSVYNGADAGSGAVTLLAMAEHFASAGNKPRRSLLFVWTIANEQGFLGAEYFADHPIVSRDRIVANVGIDLIARGAPGDSTLTLHGTTSVQQTFSAALSGFSRPFALRGDMSASVCSDGSWHTYRAGIPSVLITGGQSSDYRQPSDELTRIDFARFARAASQATVFVDAIANADARPARDRDTPNGDALCAR